jgi:hypothetical protein
MTAAQKSCVVRHNLLKMIYFYNLGHRCPKRSGRPPTFVKFTFSQVVTVGSAGRPQLRNVALSVSE